MCTCCMCIYDLIMLQRLSVGGSEPQKGPPQDEKGPHPKKKIVLAPFLGGSEACSPEKKINSGAPYYILDASQHERI